MVVTLVVRVFIVVVCPANVGRSVVTLVVRVLMFVTADARVGLSVVIFVTAVLKLARVGYFAAAPVQLATIVLSRYNVPVVLIVPPLIPLVSSVATEVTVPAPAAAVLHSTALIVLL